MTRSSSQLPLLAQDLPDLEMEVRKRFGHSGFRPGQRELVESTLRGEDALGVMPTGGGKSLCFQLPAALLPGTAVVISPLIALMKDQVDVLRSRGFAADAFHSGLDYNERRDILSRLQTGQCKLLYMSPERVQADGFMEILQEVPLSMLAIDEAHCISHWGHDFRPDYRRLGELRDRVRAAKAGQRVPVIALTATATQRVQDDIIERLGMKRFREPLRVITGFRRPNLAFEVRKVSGRAEKLRRLRALCSEALAAGGSAVIYAATRKNVELVARELAVGGADFPKSRVGYYHAGLSDDDRTEVQEAFLSGEKRVLVATNAFGMGIDKADVRLVAHYEIPGSIEAYYQEAGRAGRDGKPGRCTLLFNYADVATQEFFIKKSVEENDENDEDERSDDSLCNANADVLLKQLVRYAYGSQCRQQMILGYFGDPEARSFEGCGVCDICSPEVRSRAPVDESTQLACRQVLAAVARLNGRFGKGRIAELVKGATSETFMQTGLQHQSTYGLLRAWTLEAIRRLVDRLMDAGYLKTQGLDYPVLQITPEGMAVMRGESAVLLTIERDLSADTQEVAGATLSKASKARRKRELAQLSPFERSAASAGGSADPDLLEALRKFRGEEARKRSVPAYVVFHDSTLQELAAKKPLTVTELSGVSGLGPKKIELYGQKLLSILKPA